MLTDHHPVNHQEVECSEIRQISSPVTVNTIIPEEQCAQNIISVSEEQCVQNTISVAEEKCAQHIVQFVDAHDQSDSGSLTPVELDTRYNQRFVDMDIRSSTARVMVSRRVDQ